MDDIKQYSQVRVKHIPNNLTVTKEFGDGKVEVGDIGTVVEIYKAKGIPDGYEVECTLDNGHAKWLQTFSRNDIEMI